MDDYDSSNLLPLIVLFALIILSIFFSASETAFSALNRIRLKNMADKGSKRAELALSLHEDFNKLLSTLLVGNNIATLSAASICAVLFVRHFGDIGATLSTVVLTVVFVVFADVTPKVLAKESPEIVAQFCAPMLRFFMILFTPINHFFTLWKKVLSLAFKTNLENQTITEEELFSIVEEAEQEGVIDKDDKELIHNALEFYDQKTKDILTPRMDVMGIPKNATPSEIVAKFQETGFSRLPVYDESLDHIIGVLHMRDFFNITACQNSTCEVNIDTLLTTPVYVAPLTNIHDLFKLLQKEKNHMAIVSDEFGGTEGIVTMEDILEELVGEIWDESDEVIETFVELDESTHRVICSADLDAFCEYFQLSKNFESESSSVCGWIMDTLGKIPEEGDSFDYENLAVTIHKTENRRVLECIVITGKVDITNNSITSSTS